MGTPWSLFHTPDEIEYLRRLAARKRAQDAALKAPASGGESRTIAPDRT